MKTGPIEPLPPPLPQVAGAMGLDLSITLPTWRPFGAPIPRLAWHRAVWSRVLSPGLQPTSARGDRPLPRGLLRVPHPLGPPWPTAPTAGVVRARIVSHAWSKPRRSVTFDPKAFQAPGVGGHPSVCTVAGA
jgi:hypothetical protein